MVGPATEELRAKISAGGDVAAMTALGIRLLAGRDAPASPYEGAQLIANAAAKGGAEAAALVAVLAGAGACTPQSWPLACDYLQVAAERGWSRARAQLVLLAGDRELAARAGNGESAVPDVWKRLRESVDLAMWQTPPQPKVISDAPYLAALEDFAPPAACQWLIEQAKPRLKPASVYDTQSDGPRLANARTNSSAEFDIVETDVVLLLLRARIAAAAGFPVTNLEYTSVLHYKVGEQFRRHYDFLDPKVSSLAADIVRRGQRVATVLVYLNEYYEAGETHFPLIGIRYKGHTGGALLFRNVEPSGAPDRKTLHAGLAPTSGEKWLLSQWIRDRG